MNFGHIFTLLVNKALIVQRESSGDSWVSSNAAKKTPHVIENAIYSYRSTEKWATSELDQLLDWGVLDNSR